MDSSRRLLILSCSQRKQPDPRLTPAIERYNGPTFRVLRRYLREQPDGAKRLDIFVLSAMYGLISGGYSIPQYDLAMTTERATKLRDEVLAAFSEIICTGYTELCLAMSAKYMRALEGWPVLVPRELSVTIADGSQGLKLAQIKCWLWQGTAGNHTERQQMVEPSGVANLRGIELRLTPTQVLEQAREALAKDATNIDRFRRWYVEVDHQRVAPKWLVSKLTGLPVHAFTAGEARRMLNRLGVPTLGFVEEDLNETRSN